MKKSPLLIIPSDGKSNYNYILTAKLQKSSTNINNQTLLTIKITYLYINKFIFIRYLDITLA